MDHSQLETLRLGDRVFLRSLAMKGLLAALKLGVGFLVGSKALIADGVNSLADVLTNGGAWIGFRLAREPADEDHHYGHGSFEGLTALVVGLVLVGGALLLLWDAYFGETPALAGQQAGLAMAAAVLSILGNLWLARITQRAGEQLGSATLIALARDNRSDVLASGLVVFGAGANALGWVAAEPLAAAVIAVMIAAMGLGSARDGLDILMDRVSDGELRGRIRARASLVPGVRGVHHIRVHPLGTAQRVDLDIAVEGSISVREGHRIARLVERAVVQAEAAIVAVHVAVVPDSPAGGAADATVAGGHDGPEPGTQPPDPFRSESVR
jgi:cation diffusion facilitator family transporter